MAFTDKGVIVPATFKIDPSKSPKTIDIHLLIKTPGGDSTILGIYEVGDNTLKLCQGEPGRDRPSEFKKGPGQRLRIFKRSSIGGAVNPTPADAYCERGLRYMAIGEGDRAISQFTEAIRLDPKNRRAYLNRGHVHGSRGAYDKALADYTSAIEIDPHNADAYANRGNVHNRLGEFDKAIADCSAAIKINPEFVWAYVSRGIAYYTGPKQYEKAIADFTEAIQRDPRPFLGHANRGNVYALMGDYCKAIDDYTAAIQIVPNHADAYANRGNTYNALREYDKAIADCSRAIRLDPRSAAPFAYRGNAYNGKGEYDKAIADCTEAIRLDSKNADAHGNRGRAYEGKGQYDRASADYGEAIRLDPTNPGRYASRSRAFRLAALAPDAARPEMVLQTGHAHSLNFVAFSPDGQKALTGSSRDMAILWDVATGKQLRSFREDPLWPSWTESSASGMSAGALSPDGKTVLTASASGLMLWDVATGKALHSIKRGGFPVQALAFSPDGRKVLTASRFRFDMPPPLPAPVTLQLWDTATGKLLRSFSISSTGRTVRRCSLGPRIRWRSCGMSRPANNSTVWLDIRPRSRLSRSVPMAGKY
jgi:tetratricopeptide (TPR) repeat protein